MSSEKRDELTGFFEIIQKPDGDYAFQAVGAGEDPIVTIRFGELARSAMGEHEARIVQGMIEQGMRHVRALQSEARRRREDGSAADTVH